MKVFARHSIDWAYARLTIFAVAGLLLSLALACAVICRLQGQHCAWMWAAWRARLCGRAAGIL